MADVSTKDLASHGILHEQRPDIANVDVEEAKLQRSVQLEEIDADIFVAKKENLFRYPGARGIFGGQTICQCLHAAVLCVPSSVKVHSFHGYFMLAGDSTRDIILQVKRMRDGGSFATRAVEARQKGQIIFSASIQFQRPEPSNGLEVSAPMPNVLPPEQIPAAINRGGQADFVERRVVPKPEGEDPMEAIDYKWIRIRGRLSSRRIMHLIAISYMSDIGMLDPAYVPFSRSVRPSMMVSLDHAMWFHLPDTFRADEWLLFQTRCVRAAGARILSIGRMWTRDGDHVFSCVQEGLARHNEPLRRLDHVEAPRAKL